MNANEFANGSVIYTQSGYFAREFSKRSHGGMVGVNVGIPSRWAFSGSPGTRTRSSVTCTPWAPTGCASSRS